MLIYAVTLVSIVNIKELVICQKIQCYTHEFPFFWRKKIIINPFSKDYSII